MILKPSQAMNIEDFGRRNDVMGISHKLIRKVNLNGFGRPIVKTTSLHNDIIKEIFITVIITNNSFDLLLKSKLTESGSFVSSLPDWA